MRRVFVVAALGIALAAAVVWARGLAPRLLPVDRSRAFVYVALGDSTVEGIGATSHTRCYVGRLNERLRHVYPNVRLSNLGVAGATSEDLVAEQLSRAVRLSPALVTVAVGPNDITIGAPVEQYAKNIQVIFRRLARETHAVVVANLLPDLAITPRFRASGEAEVVGQATARFNQALEQAARTWGVTLVDLYTASRMEVPGHPELFAGDGYHPSDKGYARWAELMWQTLSPLIPARVPGG